jgi:hypothetical protein
MLTGSFASAFHGLPRATQDIDFVIAPTADQLRHLTALLPRSEYYVDEDAALEALTSQSSFNVIDLASGWKVDLICQRSRPFSLAEFARRQPIELDGVPLFIASAEDVLLSKLEWAHLGGSARQVEDGAGILRVRGDALDLAYIEGWVSALGVGREWDSARRAAGRDQ